jgi:hypothetical protein
MAADTSKAKSTEARVNALVPQVGALKSGQGRFGGFSGDNTSAPLSGTCYTDDDGLANGTISGTSGSSSSGPVAHTHGAGSYAVANGHHDHTMPEGNGSLYDSYNKLQATVSRLNGDLNSMFSALQAAGIL